MSIKRQSAKHAENSAHNNKQIALKEMALLQTTNEFTDKCISIYIYIRKIEFGKSENCLGLVTQFVAFCFLLLY